MNRVDKAKKYLTLVQNSDGGWGYYPGISSSLEPTIYAALALYSNGKRLDGSARRAFDWLATQQKSNGALSLPGQTEDHWSTLLYLLALVHTGEPTSIYEKVVEWALNYRSSASENGDEVTLDAGLIGWGWAWATFGWVEPTSYALLALKRAGKSNHSRIAEGMRLLFDRACADGGWNYGNREVLGQQLTSYIPTTALATLTLQNEFSARAVIDQGLAYIRREIGSNLSALNLALTILCFDVFGEPTNDLRRLLFSRQNDEGSWRDNVHLTSLSVLALDATDKERTDAGGGNVFRI